MGIVYLEPNNQKPQKRSKKYSTLRRGVFGYTMIVQMIFTVVGLSLIGDYVGTRFYPGTDMDLILTAIGLVVGFVVSIIAFINFIKREEAYEKHRRD